MDRAYRLSLICGAVPLAFGVSVFLIWLVTRWLWLALAGAVAIWVCLAIFAAGAVALGRFCWLAVRTPDLSRRRFWRSTLFSAALLLSNFPVGIGIAAGFVAIETCYTVVVQNTLQTPLEGVRVSGGGCDAFFGTIAPNSSARRSFWIHCDGHLQFEGGIDGTPHSQTIDDYVTPGRGDHATVTVNPDGSLSVARLGLGTRSLAF